MTKFLLLALFAFVNAAQAATPDAILEAAPLKPSQQQAQAAHLSAEVLSRYHYIPAPLDDAMSSKILDSYIKALDGEKIFFVQADIDQFGKIRTRLDDAILNENL